MISQIDTQMAPNSYDCAFISITFPGVFLGQLYEFLHANHRYCLFPVILIVICLDGRCEID